MTVDPAEIHPALLAYAQPGDDLDAMKSRASKATRAAVLTRGAPDVALRSRVGGIQHSDVAGILGADHHGDLVTKAPGK